MDRAALDFAIRHGYEHGGWCPRGRLAEDGVIPPIYQLRETDSEDYDERTEKNVAGFGRDIDRGTGKGIVWRNRLHKKLC